MAKDNSVIEKGAYIHRQSGALVEPKNFIVAEKNGKRCLLLQFTNNLQNDVNAIKFTLVMLDASGKVISKQTHSYGNLKIAPGSDYALDKGIVIKNECVDFRIQMIYAVAGDFKYFFRNGESVGTYDPRGYKEKKYSAGAKGTLQVKRRFAKSGRFHGFIAFISVLMVFAACAYVALGYFM